MKLKRYTAAAVGIIVCVTVLTGASMRRWGYRGHELTGHAAAVDLPQDMPAFFRSAVDQLTYLSPEPDRWRAPDSVASEMNRAFSYDHYIDLEALPAGALDAQDRWEFLSRARAGGVKSARDAGFLPYRIMELYQRLTHEFQLWRNEKDPARRAFIEDRILNDAGILGHYVGDAANPHHTTVHHDGWAAGYPNPANYSSARGFHSRFESKYVESHITDADVNPHMKPAVRIDDVRAGVMQHIMTSHDLLNRLYDLDRLEPFGPDTKGAAHKEFTVDRIAAGASMLRSLWWTAWLESGEPGAH
jgi:hypothetical protein